MLPYDAEVLYAFFAQYARAIWPAGPLAALLAAVVLLLALRPLAGAASGRIVAGLLALAWGWVGWGFFLERFAQLNFAAPLYGWLFLLQALLLLLTATRSRPPAFGFGFGFGFGWAAGSPGAVSCWRLSRSRSCRSPAPWPERAGPLRPWSA